MVETDAAAARTRPRPDAPPPCATAERERGFALLLTLLVTLVVGTLAITAVAVAGNATLITGYEERQNLLESVAEAGLEEARARLNASSALYPGSGFVTLEDGVAPLDAAGQPIPGVRRYLYAGPIGSTTGQHGVMGGILSIAEATNGDRVVRRLDIVQESFARYSYFTDVEEDIYFGGGDRLQGPVHSNDMIRIHPTGAVFVGPGMVTTHRTIKDRHYATFREEYQEGAARIPMPRTTELERLRTLAEAGGTAFVAPASSSQGARMRIEFVVVGGEGFFRVYHSQNDEDWVMAFPPTNQGGWLNSDNCGEHTGTPMTPDNFEPASRMGGNATARLYRLRSARARCYLGGDEALNPNAGKFHHSPPAGGSASTSGWIKRNWSLGATPPAPFSSRDDRQYLYPLNRLYNPEFKGVIHVKGNVAVSGTVRGRVTVAATGNIYIVDDLVYNTEPGMVPSCSEEAGGDMLGLFSGNDVVVANNAMNAPSNVEGTWKNLGRTRDETIHGVILALNQFRAQDHDAAQPVNAQPCEGASWSRGCLYTAGGIIQKQRGAVAVSSGRGYRKRYSYDTCAGVNPPPYFPTTGRFSRSTFYEVDPVGFDVAAFYERFSAQ